MNIDQYLVSINVSSLQAAAISSVIFVSATIVACIFIYIDYKAHKKPLKLEDPNVKYGFVHHIKKVTIPLLKYRVTVTLDFANSRNIDKF